MFVYQSENEITVTVLMFKTSENFICISVFE